MTKLYSNGCPQCKILETKLINANIPYEKISDLDEIQSKGFRSMPMLEINGTTVSYFDAIKIINKL